MKEMEEAGKEDETEVVKNTKEAERQFKIRKQSVKEGEKDIKQRHVKRMLKETAIAPADVEGFDCDDKAASCNVESVPEQEYDNEERSSPLIAATEIADEEERAVSGGEHITGGENDLDSPKLALVRVEDIDDNVSAEEVSGEELGQRVEKRSEEDGGEEVDVEEHVLVWKPFYKIGIMSTLA